MEAPRARAPMCLALLVAVLLSFPVAGSAQPLRIYHIDVEQADATLFVSPSGNTLLVDSGKNGHGSRIQAVLQRAGVSRIDHFVNTHYHEDHYGGVDDLVDASIFIGQSYDRGDKAFLPASKLTEQTFTDYEEAVGHRAVHLMRGETIPLDTSMLVTCVASGGVVLSEEDPVHGVDENDMSIALLIQYGAFRYFIGGDIEHTTEQKIAELDLVLDVDVYQANHHGSHTSSSAAFLEDLRPGVVVISNGNHSGHQHPRQSTLALFEDLTPAPAVFQTNKYLKGGQGGNVDDAHIADLETSDEDGTILIEVNPPDSVYHVSYRDTSHTFAIKSKRNGEPRVVIERLLPDPAGSDWEGEEVTLRNDGPLPVLMQGWMLQDRSGRVWVLGSLGVVAPGASVTIRRAGMPMSLNNSGDEINLLDPEGRQRDHFRYTNSARGIWLDTGH